MLNIDKICSYVESYLFSSSEELSAIQIKEDFQNAGLEISVDDVSFAIKILSERYTKEDSGLEIIKVNNNFQLVTKSENYEFLSKILSPIRKKTLTQSTLETLTIIAYNEPTTKAYIEKIKGVKSDSTINTLLDFNLIECCGKEESPGKPKLYKTTTFFLKSLGINSLKELPEYEKIKTENKAIDI